MASPMVKKLLMDKKPIIPPNLRANVLAWWDARERGQVWYGLNQENANGNFANGLTGFATTNIGVPTVANNTVNFTATAQNGCLRKSINIIDTHKYYFCAYVKANSNSVNINTGGSSGVKAHTGSGQYEFLSSLNTSTATTSTTLRISDARASGWDEISVQKWMLFDLTAIFGAGSEPTAAEMDAILAVDGIPPTYKNMLNYSPATYGEWTVGGTGSTKGVGGIHLVAEADNESASLTIKLKPSTKYGLLYNVSAFDLNSALLFVGACVFTDIIQTSIDMTPVLGSNKQVFTSNDTITLNIIRLQCKATNTDGKYIDFKDLRIYELPAGSTIESDFTTKTADELAALYPLVIGTDGKTGSDRVFQYWEGTRQVLCNPDNKYYWRDVSGNGKHMKLNNFAYSGASGWQQPYGLLTDGVDDYGVCVSSAFSISANDPCTLIICMKLNSLTSSLKHFLALPDIGELATALAIRLDATNVLSILAGGSGGTTTILSSIVPQLNMYHRFVLTRGTGVNAPLKLFLNGGEICSGNVAGNSLQLSPKLIFARQGISAVYSAQTNGVIAILSKELTHTEVKQLDDNNRGRFRI